MSLIAPSPAAARPACDPNVRRVAARTWDAPDRRDPRSAVHLADDRRREGPRLVVVADNEGILVTRDGGCTWVQTVEYGDVLSPFTGYDRTDEDGNGLFFAALASTDGPLLALS